MKRLVSLLFPFAIALLLYACGDGAGTNSSSGGGEYVLQYPEESYPMALVESRTLRAPRELVEQIDWELVRIKDKYGEAMPGVLNSYFWRPWYPVGYSIEIAVDTAIFSGTDSAGYRRLDSVAQANGARLGIIYYLWPGYAVYPEEPWYPAAAVDLFAGLPGVKSVTTGSTPIAYRYLSTLRVPDDEGTKWYFMDFCEGSYSIDIYQFRVVGGHVQHIGSFKPCVDIDTLWGRGFDVFEFAQYYADSVNALRPTWVDTAMLELDRLERCHLKSWPRGFVTGCNQ